MSGKSVLVTGGAGYIGSHTAKALAKAGFCPVVLDTLALGHRWAVQWGPLVEGDAGDEALLRCLFRQYDIQAVIHFAGNAYVSESVENPRKYLNGNVSNTLNLLNAAIDSGVKTFVFSSTCATYGIPEYLPLDENHPQSPINPYGESKLFIEKVLHWYGQAHGLRCVCLRYFNAAGADPDGDLGESHAPETHLIPLAIEAAMGSRSHLTVFGTDFPTIDGTAVRDYVHVSDLADAHVRALRFLRDGGENSVFNLGTGTGHSVRDVIRCVEKVVSGEVMVREASRRAGDPPTLVASPEKARAYLGWRPVLASLQEIVATAHRWHVSEARRSRHADLISEREYLQTAILSGAHSHDA